MIFEVPVDHFPAPMQRSRQDCPSHLRLPQFTVPRSWNASTAIEPLSPSVQRSQFSFPSGTTSLAVSLIKQELSIPPVSTPSTFTSFSTRTFSVPQLFSLPVRILSTAISLPQLV